MTNFVFCVFTKHGGEAGRPARRPCNPREQIHLAVGTANRVGGREGEPQKGETTRRRPGAAGRRNESWQKGTRYPAYVPLTGQREGGRGEEGGRPLKGAFSCSLICSRFRRPNERTKPFRHLHTNGEPVRGRLRILQAEYKLPEDTPTKIQSARIISFSAEEDDSPILTVSALPLFNLTFRHSLLLSPCLPPYIAQPTAAGPVRSRWGSVHGFLGIFKRLNCTLDSMDVCSI